MKYTGGAAAWHFRISTDFDKSSINSYTIPLTVGGACYNANIAVPEPMRSPDRVSQRNHFAVKASATTS